MRIEQNTCTDYQRDNLNPDLQMLHLKPYSRQGTDLPEVNDYLFVMQGPFFIEVLNEKTVSICRMRRFTQ